MKKQKIYICYTFSLYSISFKWTISLFSFSVNSWIYFTYFFICPHFRGFSSRINCTINCRITYSRSIAFTAIKLSLYTAPFILNEIYLVKSRKFTAICIEDTSAAKLRESANGEVLRNNVFSNFVVSVSVAGYMPPWLIRLVTITYVKMKTIRPGYPIPYIYPWLIWIDFFFL